MLTSHRFSIRPVRWLAGCALPLALLACGGDSDGPATSFSIGGSVSGLVSDGLVLQNNGADDLAIAAGAASFVFPVQVGQGHGYDVTVAAQPAGQICDVQQGGGRAQADVDGVQVVCSAAGGVGPDPTDPDPGASGGGAGPASECFNPALITAGTRYQWDMQGQAHGQVMDMLMAREIFGGATFNGQRGLVEARGTNTMTGSSEGIEFRLEQQVSHFDRIVHEAAGPVMVSYGLEADSVMSVAGMTMRMGMRIVATPPTESRELTLRKGESYTHSETTTVETTIEGGGMTRTTETESYVITYLGQEQVTVPAGTFMACKFSTNLGAEGAFDTYVAKGSGLPVVMIGEDEDGAPVRLEMLPSSHVNGTPVAQYRQ